MDLPAPIEQPRQNRAKAFVLHLLQEVGLVTLYQSPLDAKLLCLQRFVRFIAYSASTLILVAYLSALGHSDSRIGLFMTLTLFGDVCISFLLTLFADRIGRKLVLALGSLLMTMSGLIFASSENYFVLLAAAILGVISPSGNEVGPFRAVEESTLAHLTHQSLRSDIFAWYALIGSAGNAIGNMSGGWLIHALRTSGQGKVCAYRAIFYTYAAIGAVKFLLTLCLSKKVEAERERPSLPTTVSPQDPEQDPLLENSTGRTKRHPRRRILSLFELSGENRGTYVQLFLLFSLDSFASGLASNSWMVYFFRTKFDLEEGRLGSLFSSLAIVITASILVSSSVAKRIGNVKAMAFGHLPSAIMLSLIPVPSTLGPAMAALVGRACFQSMDTAPRAAFTATIIPAHERTAVMGLINIVKTMSQSMGPIVTGFLAAHGRFGLAFIIAGALKATYDLGILIVFASKSS
ncbi:MFS general substrate transporter [Aureobasidium pullulans]|uniref:MFS general substrate transporter n=1 Tax=Aureobasidium pullulans TaxID=5580 RepID=A0AB74JCP1_AURPU|nr:MFS general substrate transporter [Aureobasidium pullulans]THX37072.1 MFS general substrate transporter [Aureobasidium pullulans]